MFTSNRQSIWKILDKIASIAASIIRHTPPYFFQSEPRCWFDLKLSRGDSDQFIRFAKDGHLMLQVEGRLNIKGPDITRVRQRLGFCEVEIAVLRRGDETSGLYNSGQVITLFSFLSFFF